MRNTCGDCLQKNKFNVGAPSCTKGCWPTPYETADVHMHAIDNHADLKAKKTLALQGSTEIENPFLHKLFYWYTSHMLSLLDSLTHMGCQCSNHCGGFCNSFTTVPVKTQAGPAPLRSSKAVTLPSCHVTCSKHALSILPYIFIDIRASRRLVFHFCTDRSPVGSGPGSRLVLL